MSIMDAAYAISQYGAGFLTLPICRTRAFLWTGESRPNLCGLRDFAWAGGLGRSRNEFGK
jgi:hypothetical protein